MKIEYIIGDLLLYGERCPIAHCISGDLALGAGLAKKLENKFKIKKEFIFMGISQSAIGRCIKTNNIFNLVTKVRYNDKPKPEDLLRALTDMKIQMKKENIRKIYIPTIACGLDKLKWSLVCDILSYVFHDEPIDITVVLPDMASCVKFNIPKENIISIRGVN